MDEFSKLPRAVLPESVTIQQCKSSIEIQTACDTILVDLANMDPDHNLVLACDIEWEFSTGRTGTSPQKTALITIARPSIVYLMKVFHLTKLPTSLITILNSMRKPRTPEISTTSQPDRTVTPPVQDTISALASEARAAI